MARLDRNLRLLGNWPRFARRPEYQEYQTCWLRPSRTREATRVGTPEQFRLGGPPQPLNLTGEQSQQRCRLVWTTWGLTGDRLVLTI